MQRSTIVTGYWYTWFIAFILTSAVGYIVESFKWQTWKLMYKTGENKQLT